MELVSIYLRLGTMNNPCIYKIYNQVNNDIYIGSTVSLGLRKWYHLKDLNKKTHCNYKLQNAFNSGIKLLFEVIEYVPFKMLVEREQYWMDTLKPRYNIILIAERKITKKQSKYKKLNKYQKKAKDLKAEDLVAINGIPPDIKWLK